MSYVVATLPLSMYGLNHLVYQPSASSSELSDLRHRAQECIIAAPSDDLRPPRCVPDAVVRRGRLARWIHLEDSSAVCRCLTIEEVEVGMGYPVGYTSLPPAVRPSNTSEAEWLRHSITGHAFAVQTVSFVLEGLSAVFGGASALPPPRDLSSLAATHDEDLRILSSASSSSWSLPSNAGR